MKISNKFLFALVTLFLLILPFNSNFSEAALLGVNRAEISFNNVLRGGYAENTFKVSIGTEKPVAVSYEARGEIADWIRFEPSNQTVLVNEDSPKEIKVIVEPPLDAAVGNYKGKVLVSTGNLGNITERMGANVMAAFEITINVNINDTQIFSCDAGGFSIQSSEVNEPLVFYANVINKGNVRVRPTFIIEILNQQQDIKVEHLEYTPPFDILPTASESISAKFDVDLETGQYWARIRTEECNLGDIITFDVLYQGEIKDDGELIRIENEPWASVNEIVPIQAKFKNKGSRTVNAYYKGIISRGEEIVEILHSEEIEVGPGEVIPLEMYFTPTQEGQYKIKGRVYYNDKITFEKGSILNVVDNKSSYDRKTTDFDIITIIFTLLIVVIGLILFFIIQKKTKRKGL
ncbi:MAG: hypothetical protein PWQ87_121 [Candidatus Woesearchaeota archaeon]|nr:hypothetical protein [Candidatus Woesearchaeota archaeon]